MKTLRLLAIVTTLFITVVCANAQNTAVEQRLKGLDATIQKILKDWNVPGCGIGIVEKGKLVYAKGYGYRDLEKKLPVTPNTSFQIASNTKLFTATAIGLLVDEGKLDWDKPIRGYVPQIQFYNEELTANVTIRDMLSHRTGISRHDNIWYKSDFSRQELFDRIKYLEPSIPLRSGYLYNNLMYGAAGSVVEYISKLTWEDFVTNRIFKPLGMSHSMFLTEDMIKQPDFMRPYYEKRDTSLLLPYPYYMQFQGVGPCGSIISSINDLSHWLVAQMNQGKFDGKQILPAGVIRDTMQPASMPGSVPDKYFENLNSIYGMGRSSSSYKGHYKTRHGGAIGGIYSEISFMPADSVGVIVFTNGAHVGQLPSIITSVVYDKLLKLGDTPWSERNLKDYLKEKETDRQARKKPDTDKVPNTKPSHALSDYKGTYQDAAYGVMEITQSNEGLGFYFHNTTMPLHHYHYDRFVSADDEVNGKWSLVFTTDAQGSIQNVKVSLDEKEVVFMRKADAKLSDPAFLKTLTGQYELNGTTMNVVISNKELMFASAPPQHLEPYKNSIFKVREFSDQLVEFVLDGAGLSTGFKLTFDGKTVLFTKKN